MAFVDIERGLEPVVEGCAEALLFVVVAVVVRWVVVVVDPDADIATPDEDG